MFLELVNGIFLNPQICEGLTEGCGQQINNLGS